MAALTAVTAAASALRTDNEPGTIAPSSYADILALGKDPAANVRKLRSLEKRFRAGQADAPAAILAGYPARDMNHLGKVQSATSQTHNPDDRKRVPDLAGLPVILPTFVIIPAHSIKN